MILSEVDQICANLAPRHLGSTSEAPSAAGGGDAVVGPVERVNQAYQHVVLR